MRRIDTTRYLRSGRDPDSSYATLVHTAKRTQFFVRRLRLHRLLDPQAPICVGKVVRGDGRFLSPPRPVVQEGLS